VTNGTNFFFHFLQLLDGLVAEYEVAAAGSSKYQKLVKFLQKTLAGSLHDLVKRASDRAAAEYSSLEIQGRSMVERLAFAGKQAEAAEWDAQEWKKRYEMSLVDYRKSAENSAAQYAALQWKVTSLEEKSSNLGRKLEGSQKESLDWQSKYEHLLIERRTDQERMGSEYAAIQNRCSTAEARLAAVQEQAESAIEEAAELQRKYDAFATSSRTATEKAMAERDQALEESQLREDTLRAEFSAALSQKDGEVKELQAAIEQGERHIAGLTARLQEHESKVSSQSEEVGILRFEIRHFQQEVEAAKSLSMTLTKDLEKARQDKLHAEERVKDAVSRLEEAEGRCKVAERETKHAVEVAENAWNEAKLAEREKRESERLAIERLAAVERLQREFETLQRGRGEIAQV
jgi:chromosome segregation ATPase